MLTNPYRKYQTTQISTASTGDLVVLLYDGAVQSLLLAEDAIEARRWTESTSELIRAQKIIMELNNGIDLERGGDLAVKLRGLYLYMYRILVEASIEKNVAQVQHIRGLLDQLRASWRAVVKGEPIVQSSGAAA
jgi:flagellar secretion chaperone FliS